MEWALFLLISFSILIRIVDKGIIPSKYYLWLSVFVAFVLSSYFWSKNTDYALTGVKVVINIIPISIYLKLLIRNKYDIEKIVKIFIMVSFFTSIVVIVKTLLTSSSISRLTSEFGGNWNPNEFGLQMAFALCLYIAYCKGDFSENINVQRPKVSIVMFFTTIILLTGSKKSLFVIVLFILLYYGLLQVNKRFKSIIYVLLSITIIFYIIYNVPFLYEIIGLRVDQLISSIGLISTNNRSGDLIRLEMIERGWAFFKESPLIVTDHGTMLI